MKRVGQIIRESVVDQLKDGIGNNSNVFLLTYKNASSSQISDLRMSLRKAGAEVYVSKNKLAEIALKQMEHAELADRLCDQIAFVWSNADSAEIAKVLVKYTKDSEQLSVQGGLLEGKILAQGDVQKLSDLPSREVLLSMLLSAVQSPLSRMAGVLNAKTRELVSVLKQISEKKGGN